MTRPIKYKFFGLKDNSPLASRTTIWTGSIIGIFLYIHLKSFFIPSRFATVKVSNYALVMQAFSNPWYDMFYLVALLVARLSSAAWISIGIPNTRASE